MKNKNFLLGMLATVLLLVFGMVLAGCGGDDDGGTEGPPSGHLGDGGLSLSGDIVRESQDEATGAYTYTKITTGGTLSAYIDSPVATATVTNGAFSFEVPTPSDTALSSISATSFNFDNIFTDVTVGTGVKGAELYLRLGSEDVERKSSAFSGNIATSATQTEEYVTYYYFDSPLTVTLTGGTRTQNGATSSASDTTLKFEKGWNALYAKYVMSGNQASGTETISLSVANPNLKWVLPEIYEE